MHAVWNARGVPRAARNKLCVPDVSAPARWERPGRLGPNRTRDLYRDSDAFARNQLKLDDTGGSRGRFQSTEKELPDHNFEDRSFTVVEATEV